MAIYELWNVESGNLIGTFSDEDAALDAVAESLARNGPAYGDLLALGRENSRGDSKIIARERPLADRVARRRQVSSSNVRERRAPAN